MKISEEKTIGEIVASDYRTAAVFKSYGIDFCCKGNRTLAEACDRTDLSYDTLMQKLDKAVQTESAESISFIHWPIDLLIDYIEKKHHRYVKEKAPELNAYLEKVSQVHGSRHPELFEIKELFSASIHELFAHMRKEEEILFPVVRQMAETRFSGAQRPHRPAFKTVQMPINMMMHEHATEGDRFRRIAELSNNYTPPQDACNTYKVAFALLREFEEDLHKHIHLENNILFPRAIEMEKELLHANTL